MGARYIRIYDGFADIHQRPIENPVQAVWGSGFASGYLVIYNVFNG